MNVERLVISKRYTGLGDCMVSLLSAWSFAKRTQRMLVADWRFSIYYQNDKSINLFSKVFESPDKLAGVPFIGDNRVSDLHPSGSFYMPEIWNNETLHAEPVGGERGDAGAIRELLESDRDASEDIVVIERCLTGRFVNHEDAKLFFSYFHPLPPIKNAVNEYRSSFFADNLVIGIHIRHGNGGNIMGHGKFWKDPELALRKIDECIGQVKNEIKAKEKGKSVVLFLCTDSPLVQQLFCSKYPDMLVRAKSYRPVRGGELHIGKDASEGLSDALTEMFLLAHCHVLIRYPDSSFSIPARYLKPECPVLVTEKLNEIPEVIA